MRKHTTDHEMLDVIEYALEEGAREQDRDAENQLHGIRRDGETSEIVLRIGHRRFVVELWEVI